MGFLHNAVAALKLATATPEATEINNYVADTYQEAKTEKVELASGMIKSNTHDKVLSIADFTDKSPKSREKMDGDPTPEEIKQAKAIFKEMLGLKNDMKTMTAYIDAHIADWSPAVIRILIDSFEAESSKYSDLESKRDEKIREINNGHSEQYQIKKEQDAQWRDLNDKTNFYSKLMSEFAKRLRLLKEAKLTAASEKGVSDYREIPANSPLDSLVKRMKMEFKENSDGDVEVWINGVDTKYAFYPQVEYFKYKIYAVADNEDKLNAIVFEKIFTKDISRFKKDDKSYEKFVIDDKNSGVIEFNKNPTNKNFSKEYTYPLPATTNSREKVVQN